MKKKQINFVCFISQWNEGRSPHLEMSVELKLKQSNSKIKVISAGFSLADKVNPLLKAFLLGLVFLQQNSMLIIPRFSTKNMPKQISFLLQNCP